MPRLSDYLRNLIYVLGDNLGKVLLHHGLELVHRAWHGDIVPANPIEPSMDGLGTLLPEKPKTNSPFLEEWYDMILHHV